jgi:alpha-ketoglutarate-dependent taurine dioxygenase
MAGGIAMTVAIRPMDAPIAAEVQNVDLAQDMDGETFRTIEDALAEHSVLVFRDQDLTEDQQLRFSRRFGDLEAHVLSQYNHPKHPEILIVSNVKENGQHVGIYDAGRYWHTDLSYMAVPSKGSILYAIEIPQKAGEPLGDTLFASSAAAYDALPDDIKARIDGLSALYSLDHRHKKLVADGDAEAVLSDEAKKKAPECVHHIVQRHPVTGRKILYVNEGQTAEILDMPAEEGQTLLKELLSYCSDPSRVYRHKWRVGDVVMWDNLPTQHLAIADYQLPDRRYLWRTTLRGQPMG